MKHILSILILTLASVSVMTAQTTFPGLNAETKKQLTATKRSVAFALPTWLPQGFTLTQVHSVVGPKVKLEDKQLVIVYSREVANGKLQRFAFEAGFDGIGDLMYEGPRTLTTPIGKVHLYYQPKDEDGKKIMDFAMTEWFDIRGTAFHYTDRYGTEEEGGDRLTMISLADTEKILKSLKRY
ncbi:MAG: hypothetical protein IPK98_12230 [Chloracidobacterium sp.]|nr:hypothetical protein [Chloracidobacterium sp.]